MQKNEKIIENTELLAEEKTGQYDELMAYFKCAMMEIETKFRVLNEEFSLQYDRNPISAIKSRLKTFKSIRGKLIKNEFPLTVNSVEENLNDVAGVRVICSFERDVYLLAEDGSNKKIGYMRFSRTSDTSFYLPQKILFYSGKALQGGGIYALVSLYNMENPSQTSEKIYEVSADYSYWEANYNYHIPTVFINGRGEGYDKAKSLGIAYTGAPTSLQALNMLTDSFYAYYSSDGYSSSFRLPFLDIANKPLMCRLYYTTSSYVEWIILENSTSNTQQAFGASITLHVDRARGILYFKNGSNSYSLPQIKEYSENNIRVLACKEIPEGFKTITRAECCISTDSKILVAGGNRLYSASYDNPLYFPQEFGNEVGFADNKITHLNAVGSKIYAFKKNELYEIALKKGDALNKIALLCDNDDIFYKPDTFSIEKIAERSGEAISTATFRNSIIWYTEDGRVLTLASGEITELSSAVNSYLRKLNDYEKSLCISASNGNEYILCFHNKAVIMKNNGSKLNENNVAWYIWEFPTEITIKGIISAKEPFVFLCVNLYGLGFTAALEEIKDKYFEQMFSTAQLQEKSVDAYIKTKRFSFRNFCDKANIKAICLELENQGTLKLLVSGNSGELDFSLPQGAKNTVKINTNLPNLKEAFLELQASDSFSLGKGEIHFV